MSEDYQPQHHPRGEPPKTEEVERGFHIEVISNKTVFAWAAPILGLAVLAVVVSFGLWAWLDATSERAKPLTGDEATPLDPHQRQTRLQFEAEQQAILNSYGWVEPDRGIVRVPIERAMELLMERTKSR